MIVCKKPWTIYDVDLAGLSALTVLGLLTYFLVILPVREHWDSYRDLSVQQQSSETVLRQTGNQLRKVEADVARLKAAIVSLAEQAPQPSSLPQFLSRTTILANEWPAYDIPIQFYRPAWWTDLPRWSFHENNGAGTLPGQQDENGNNTVFPDGHVKYVTYWPALWSGDDFDWLDGH